MHYEFPKKYLFYFGNLYADSQSMEYLKNTKIVAYLTSSVQIGLFLAFHSRFKLAHSFQKKPNLHKNELNTTFFCSTSPLKAPNRLKSLIA
jgi:hypothetical protein